MAALQMMGVQENASAMRHTQATWFASDMADRMRANLDYGTPTVPVDQGDRADHYKGIDVSAASSATGQTCGAADNCNLSQMRNFDSDEWRALLLTLPGGRGTVTEDNSVNGRYYVRVMWNDDVRTGVKSTGCPSDPNIPQTCVEIVVQP
jgi:type IV pilus assembly protein PilV